MRGSDPVPVARPRPLSGGLWTLLGWLRREERGSSDSLSSAGSDRTAASFAFLQGPPPRRADAALPPATAAPPTDTYRRRLRDRNLRRHQDRDLTLRRKYGLLSEGGYDAFSLPPARLRESSAGERQERGRRAVSEGSPRPAHVPGKRRAPQPPPPPPPPLATASLTRRHTRKRRAPLPPVPTAMNPNKPEKEIQTSDTSDMNPRSSYYDIRPQSSGEYHYILDCKPEKYSKKEESPKESKPRTEKSFIKQLFENKKRNSAVETTKILPNISELDRQAADIIASCKLKPLEQNNNFSKHAAATASHSTTWFCTMCLRKYDSSVVTCTNCLPDKTKVSLNAPRSASGAASAISKNKSNEINGDEKQKLKEMLKEMKDSLPKKGKNEHSKGTDKLKRVCDKKPLISTNFEPATLKIGFAPDKSNEAVAQLPSQEHKVPEVNTTKVLLEEARSRPGLRTMAESVVVTQPVVLVAPQFNAHDKDPVQKPNSITVNDLDRNKPSASSNDMTRHLENAKPNNGFKVTHVVTPNHTPIRLSSLLNPVYKPKNNNRSGEIFPSSDKNVKSLCESAIKTEVIRKDDMVTNNKKHTKQDMAMNTEGIERVHQNNASASRKTNVLKTSFLSTAAPRSAESSSRVSESDVIRLSAAQHSRRRELINQLEQSIAKGDERCAADAAMKLAQLKLSCAVLSFSSQIVGETLGSPAIKTAQGSFQGPSSSKVNVSPANKSAEDKINLPPTKDTVAKTPPTAKKVVQECKTELGKNNKPAALTEPSTSRLNTEDNNTLVPIEVWVEDREATRGPVRLAVPRGAGVGELRRRAERQLGLAAPLQRWIVGRTLCLDDAAPLAALAGPNFAEPFYLCLVEETAGASVSQATSETTAKSPAKLTSEENKIEPQSSQSDQTGNVYSELMQLERRALVANVEPFQCVVCLEECGSGDGAVLRECVHTFCRECLADLVRHCEEPAVACPAMGCPGALQEREIRALVTPEDYEKWLARGLAAAESGTRNAFHCRTRDCNGWALCDPGVLRFPCPVCKKTNCVPCKAIHEGETCEQHRKKLEKASESDSPNSAQTDEGTRALLDTLISKGEALECPECSAIISKKWGCDWVKCSACKTEICWVTRGRRWGPAGRGDTSAGCRCGVDGKKCHPSCGYCH